MIELPWWFWLIPAAIGAAIAGLRWMSKRLYPEQDQGREGEHGG